MSRSKRAFFLATVAVACVTSACAVLRSTDEQPAGGAAVSEKFETASAYVKRGNELNARLSFPDAAREYSVAALGTLPTADPRSDLKYALALSNIGRFSDADRLFSRFDDYLVDNPSQVEQAELLTYRAQDAMNRWHFGSAQEAERTLDSAVDDAEEAASLLEALRLQDVSELERQAEALSSTVKLEQDGGGIKISSFAEKYMQNQAAATGTISIDSRDALTPEQRRNLLEAHARFVAGYARYLKGDLDGASGQAEKTREPLDTLPSDYAHWIFSGTDSLQGRLALAKGGPQNTSVAIAAFNAALEQILALGHEGTLAAALAEMQLGEAYAIVGDGAAAAKYFQQGVDTAAKSGAGLDINSASGYLSLLAEEPQSPERDDKIFKVLQVARSTETAQALAEVTLQIQFADSREGERLRDYIKLGEEQKALEAKVSRIRGQGREPEDILLGRLANIRADAQSAREDAGELISIIENLDDELIALAEFRSKLQDGEVVVAIHVGAQGSFVTTISRDDFDFKKVDYTTADAVADVDSLKPGTAGAPGEAAPAKRHDFETAHRLYRDLVAPAVNLLPAQGGLLTVAPTGPLLSLPFDLLTTEPYDGGELRSGKRTQYYDYSDAPWLARRVASATALSLSSLYNTRLAAPSKAPRAFAGFGDFTLLSPDAAAEIAKAREAVTPGCQAWFEVNGANKIDGASAEINVIRGIIGEGAELYTQSEFSDSAVRATDLKSYRVLHFATHGMLDTDPGAERCLTEPALWTSYDASAGESDALLSASEIAQLEFDADLVVLSACDTGGASGLTPDGGGLSGLTRSFFVAKARNVIASHWKVNDTATSLLMEKFYRELAGQEERGLSEAMRAARLSMMEHPNGVYSHPAFWAGFAVYGNGASKIRL